MAFGWDDLIMVGATILGGNAAKDAGKKSAQGSAAALAEQQRQFNIGLNMLEPQRGLGYGALNDIASLYGYSIPGYTPLNQLGQAGIGGSGAIDVKGRRRGNREIAGISVNPFNRGSHSWGGTIDPFTGMVDVANGHENKDKFLTNYLRTGEWEGGVGRYRDLKDQIDKLRASGWSYDPATGQTSLQARQGQVGQPGEAGPAGNMSRFFASPDYNFRRDEGVRGIEQGAAARGGALSGNALRGVSNFNSNLASGEFGNYMNRLFNIAGMGQTATSQGVGLSQNYGVNAGNLMQQQADSRASGVMGAANTYASGIGSLVNNQLLKRLLGQQGGNYEVPEDIRNFQYPFGG